MRTKTAQVYKVGRDALTSGQIEILLNSFDKISENALIQLAIACGIRRNDIVNIKKTDLDLERGKIKFIEHKKGRRIWEVSIPSQRCIATLRQHLSASRPSIWLFPSPKKTGKYEKTHLSDRQAYDILNEALDRCKLPRIPFHALRATCVKQCLKAGWSWEAISELTGDLISTLQFHYATPSKGEMDMLAKEKPIL